MSQVARALSRRALRLARPAADARISSTTSSRPRTTCRGCAPASSDGSPLSEWRTANAFCHSARSIVYRTLKAATSNSTAGYAERATAAVRGRVAQGRHDRHRSFHGHGAGQRRPRRARRAASWRCSRHDIRGALQGVIGGDRADRGGRACRPSCASRSSASAAAARTLACLVGAVLGDEPEPAAAEGQPRVELQRFLRYLRRRYGGEARERGLALRGREPRPALPAALRVDLVAARPRWSATWSATRWSTRRRHGAAGGRRAPRAAASSSASPTRGRGSPPRRSAGVRLGAAGDGRPGRGLELVHRQVARRPARRRDHRSATARPAASRRCCAFPPRSPSTRAAGRRARPAGRSRRPARAARRGQSDQPDGRDRRCCGR